MSDWPRLYSVDEDTDGSDANMWVRPPDGGELIAAWWAVPTPVDVCRSIAEAYERGRAAGGKDALTLVLAKDCGGRSLDAYFEGLRGGAFTACFVEACKLCIEAYQAGQAARKAILGGEEP